MVDRVGERFGDYRLKRLISDRGAFADVYEGEHVVDRTKAAVKVWKVQIEAQTFLNDVHAAVLTHPHIVKLLDFGSKSDVPYLVMAYAPHGSLQAQPLPLSLASIVTYVREIADGLHYAHQRGIVHRDIKPDNILLGPLREIWVGDFGIATPSYTRQEKPEKQEVAGTYAYMAPEQIQGHASSASDQYSLGIMVYEWLCGERPFQGNAMQLMYQHLHVLPPPLHEKFPAISSVIEHVVLRALAKDQEQRFESIDTFAKALDQAYQEMDHSSLFPQSSVLVRTTSSLDLPRVRIPPPPTGTSFYTCYGPANRLHALSWSLQGLRLAWVDFDKKKIQVWDATAGSHLSTYHGHDAKVRYLRWSPDGTHIASSSWGEETVRIWDAATGSHLFTVPNCRSVTWTPDGTYIATEDFKDHLVHIWNITNGNHHALQIKYPWSWSPNGKDIAVTAEKEIQVWDIVTGQSRIIYRGHSNSVTTFAWSPDGKRIASSALDEKNVHVWDAFTGKHIFTYNGYSYLENNWQHWSHKIQVYRITWSPNGAYITSDALYKAKRNEDGRARARRIRDQVDLVAAKSFHIWSVSDRSCTFSFERPGDFVWSPDSKYIAIAGKYEPLQFDLDESISPEEKAVHVLDIATGRRVISQSRSGSAGELTWSPDSKCIASTWGSSTSSPIQIWNRKDRRRVFFDPSQASDRQIIGWAADSIRIASLSRDKKTIQVWDALTGELISSYNDHSNQVHAAVWSPDGLHIASFATDESTIQVWDTATGKRGSTYDGHSEEGVHKCRIIWSPDGRFIASCGEGYNIAHVWDAATGRTISTYRGYSSQTWIVTWSPNSSHITSINWNGITYDSDPMSLESNFAPKIHDISWSPDGTRIASASRDRGVQVWDASSGNNILTYGGHTDEVHTVVWSPDGMRIASVSLDQTVRLWDASSGSDFLTYIGHADEGTIVAIDWSPDGKYLASGSLYGPIHVWETITGRDIVTYEFHSHGERFVVKWLDNGARIAVEDDQRVHVWEILGRTQVSTYYGDNPKLSPDGTHIALSLQEIAIDIWQAT